MGSAWSSLNWNVSGDTQAPGFIIFLFPWKFREGKKTKKKTGRDFLCSWWVGGNVSGSVNMFIGVSFLETTPIAMAVSLLIRYAVKFNPCPQHVLLFGSMELSRLLQEFNYRTNPVNSGEQVLQVWWGRWGPTKEKLPLRDSLVDWL